MYNVPQLPDTSSNGEDHEYLYEDDTFAAEYPAIFEHLSRVKCYGGNRAPSRLIVYGEAGRLCLCLTDPYSSQVLFHNDQGFTEALEGLEKRLQAGTKDWRADKKSRYAR